MDTDSYLFFANGYGLTRAHMVFFREAYLPEKSDTLYASPLLTKDLRNLPPAMIVTAGFDVLRDEGQAYAKQLGQAENQVETIHYPGMIHGFATMGRIFPEGFGCGQKVCPGNEKNFALNFKILAAFNRGIVDFIPGL